MTRSSLLVFAALLLVTGGAGDLAARGLRVGTECTNYPFSYRDTAGEPAGYDIDVMREIGARIERNISFVCQRWRRLIRDLVTNQTEVIASSMAITASRREQAIFTTPYRIAAGQFAALAGARLPLFTPDGRIDPLGFAGQRIGVQSYSIYDNWLGDLLPQANVERFDKTAELYAALQAGALDAILADPIKTHLEFLGTDAGIGFAAIGPRIHSPEHFGPGAGFGLKPGHGGIRDDIDEALSAMQADGALDAISRRYFPFPIYPRTP